MTKEIRNVKSDVLTEFLKKKKYNKIIAIGDRESDIRAGKNCGAITYLFINPDFNENTKNTEADYIISDLKEVLKEL